MGRAISKHYMTWLKGVDQMFLHIGGDLVVALQDVVAIVDARTVQESKADDSFIAAAIMHGMRNGTSDGEPSAYVVTNQAVYASTISPNTLRRRAASPYAVKDETDADEGAFRIDEASATGEQRDKSNGFE